MTGQQPGSRPMALLIAGTITVAALLLAIDRSGLIAWATLVFGIALLIKIWLKPSRSDPGLGLGLAAVATLAWAGTFHYVISTWESGEVVELAIDTDSGTHTARVWALDMGEDPVIYYDAGEEAAESLLAGRPLQITRGGEVSTRIPDAKRVEELPEAEANRVFEAMVAKYGDRVDAADIYYLMLGRAGDRIAVVARLRPQ